jgi:hypothetical protein
MVLLADKELPSLGAGLSKVVVLPESTAGELKVDMIEELIRRLEGQTHSMAAKLSAAARQKFNRCRSVGYPPPRVTVGGGGGGGKKKEIN